MKYCSNCGSKIEEDDLFCTNCGAKQEQTEQPDHQNATHLKAEPENCNCNNNSNSNSNSNMKSQIELSGIKDIFLNMFTKPVTGAKQFIEKAEKNTVLSITIILALIQGLLGMWRVSQVVTSFQSIAMNTVKKVSNLMDLIHPSSEPYLDVDNFMSLTTEINKIKSLINIPYGKVFIQNIILFFISLAILFIIVYLMLNIISKNKSDAFLIYKAALIVIVPTLYFEILSIVFSYASIYVGLAIALIGIIISLGTLSIVIKESLNVNENYSVFAVSISFIVILISIIACSQKFSSSNISNILRSFPGIMELLN